jgi:endonuclease/exonuclease/phosphatase family metal-dependent hydrolase
VSRALAAALVAGLLACASASNYLDPGGPRYEGTHAATRDAAAPPAAIRVVTFNIEYALRVDRAIAALQRHDQLRGADLLLLQEMDAEGTEAIAQALGLNYVYFPACRHPKTNRDLGNAVLSPWPIEASWKLPLPHKSRIVGQARAAVGVRVSIGGRALRVYSVHLGSPFGASGGQRRAQAEVVLADARDSADPVVIGGDFNSKGLGKLFRSAGYLWPTEHAGSSTRIFSFDHVFVRGLGTTSGTAGVVREADDASDHRPVWALIPTS